MKSAKLHHYVPQFYLRRFINSEGYFWVWDKKKDKSFRATPKTIAAETDFYKLYDFLAMGRDPLLMEKQFSEMESNVSLITEQWLGWLSELAPREKIRIPSVNRKIVSLYIALQFFRTADTKDVICALERDRSSAELSDEEKTRLHTKFLWELDLIKPVAKRIETSIWIFGRNQSGQPFLTSDNPVAFKTGDNRMWLKAGILTAGTYVVFPLSPEIVMYCHDRTPQWRKLAEFDTSVSPVVFDIPMIEHENAGQVFMASRFVISPINDFRWAREFALSIGTDLFARPQTKEKNGR
jgi:hypothetical protein